MRERKLNDPGHMTKMAATHIYGKNPLKIFSVRADGIGIGDVGFVQVMILD